MPIKTSRVFDCITVEMMSARLSVKQSKVTKVSCAYTLQRTTAMPVETGRYELLSSPYPHRPQPPRPPHHAYPAKCPKYSAPLSVPMRCRRMEAPSLRCVHKGCKASREVALLWGNKERLIPRAGQRESCKWDATQDASHSQGSFFPACLWPGCCLIF